MRLHLELRIACWIPSPRRHATNPNVVPQDLGCGVPFKLAELQVEEKAAGHILGQGLLSPENAPFYRATGWRSAQR